MLRLVGIWGQAIAADAMACKALEQAANVV